MFGAACARIVATEAIGSYCLLPRQSSSFPQFYPEQVDIHALYRDPHAALRAAGLPNWLISMRGG
ncbi:hypothetical protein IE4771_CH01601 [Rhizobium etli bv. mimosae str. IE4771]|uniref:Uncharacterized protein n=1 Tax=Rhizobium etli bv. mimosae str. IE4771 TaxID=1432050 RepID=A0A060HZ26_RHIET|nr:hypothetical protein IE4771_CH01601 [Rhizobium sp. IE4771]